MGTSRMSSSAELNLYFQGGFSNNNSVLERPNLSAWIVFINIGKRTFQNKKCLLFVLRAIGTTFTKKATASEYKKLK